jgi:hypothetical protein
MKKIINGVLIIFLSIILGSLAMFCVYSLPTERIYEHVEESEYLFEEAKGKITNWSGEYKQYSKIDNSTDSLMLLESICRYYDSNIYNCLLNPRNTVSDDYNEDYSSSDISVYLEHCGDEVEIYPRYWHGYLLYVIPSLLFFNYGEIRVLLMTIQIVLIVLLGFELMKINKLLAIPFCLLIAIINPVTTSLNLATAFVFVFSMIESLILIYVKKPKKDFIFYFFLISGILTAFFDYLTYSPLCLGLPLTVYLLTNDNDYKSGIKTVFISGISFVFGYAFMWFGKWAIATLLTDVNVIGDGINSSIYRSSEIPTGLSTMGYCETLDKLFSILQDRAMTLIIYSFIIIFVLMIIIFYRKDIKIKGKSLLSIIPFIIIAIIPFVWYFVVRNHSISHSYFEYRQLSLTFFAIMASIINIINKSSSKDLLNQK